MKRRNWLSAVTIACVIAISSIEIGGTVSDQLKSQSTVVEEVQDSETDILAQDVYDSVEDAVSVEYDGPAEEDISSAESAEQVAAVTLIFRMAAFTRELPEKRN